MTGDTDIWHVPFQGRNPSEVYRQNFLYQYKNIYVMDNHRAAYWCWRQAVDLDKPFNLLHIDRHTDALQSRIELWDQALPPVETLSIEDYLSAEIHDRDLGATYPVVRWDNYLSLCLHRHHTALVTFFSATHGEGDAPKPKPTLELHPWEVPGEIRYLAEHDPSPWICNVDLDYFFYSQDQKIYGQLVSDDYLVSLFSTLKTLRANGVISVVTLCLSPECCGGWRGAECIAYHVCDLLEVPFRLPDDD